MTDLFTHPQNFFRAGVGAIIKNSLGKVLVLERTDVEGAWQFPQGGIDGDESPNDALWREVEEETGIEKVHLDIEKESEGWLVYEFNKERQGNCRGQTQKWYVVRIKNDAYELDLEKASADEFRDHQWVSMDEAVDLAVDFKRPLYRKLREEFGN